MATLSWMHRNGPPKKRKRKSRTWGKPQIRGVVLKVRRLTLDRIFLFQKFATMSNFPARYNKVMIFLLFHNDLRMKTTVWFDACGVGSKFKRDNKLNQ